MIELIFAGGLCVAVGVILGGVTVAACFEKFWFGDDKEFENLDGGQK